MPEGFISSDALNGKSQREMPQFVIKELRDWHAGNPTRLERPDGSAWYRVKEASADGRLLAWTGEKEAADRTFFSGMTHQVFVFEHDWALAFANADGFDDGEVPLPFDQCVFEFKINGKRIVVLTANDPERSVYHIEELGGGSWIGKMGTFADLPRPNAPGSRINEIVYANIRALCVALDAELAETEVVRAPHKLNRQREKMGRMLLNDYHTVRLAHRSRVAPLPLSGTEPSHGTVRLHFRRGHWRHFDDHKTWVKWCLVGNPDLGFIDKHYRA